MSQIQHSKQVYDFLLSITIKNIVEKQSHLIKFNLSVFKWIDCANFDVHRTADSFFYDMIFPDAVSLDSNYIEGSICKDPSELFTIVIYLSD